MALNHPKHRTESVVLAWKNTIPSPDPTEKPGASPILATEVLYNWRTANSMVAATGQRGDAYESGWVRQALADSTTTQQCPGWMEVLWWRKQEEMESVYACNKASETEKKNRSDMPQLLRCHLMLNKAMLQHWVGGIRLKHIKIKAVNKSLEKMRGATLSLSYLLTETPLGLPHRAQKRKSTQQK